MLETNYLCASIYDVMIQRLQSAWLLLASLAIFALFLFPIVHGVYIGGVPKTIKVTGVYEDIAGQMMRTVSFLALTVVTIIMGLLPIVIIFRFKDRKQQMALCYGFILANFGFSFWMSKTVQDIIDTTQIRTDNFGIGALMSTVSIIFILLAVRSIKNDEKLIKSADRLR